LDLVEKESDDNKSLDPDGFNFAFFKQFWISLRMRWRFFFFFYQLHGNEVFPKCLLSYLVTLYLKMKGPISLKEFRPILLLGSWYKLLSKALAARIEKLMKPIISTSQSPFLKGWQLVEGVMIVNEVVDLAKRFKRECLILKVDFEKTFDSVDWSFLEYMLRRCRLGGWKFVCLEGVCIFL